MYEGATSEKSTCSTQANTTEYSGQHNTNTSSTQANTTHQAQVTPTNMPEDPDSMGKPLRILVDDGYAQP